MPTTRFPNKWVRVPLSVQRLSNEFQIVCNLRPAERPPERKPVRGSVEWVMAQVTESWATDPLFRTWLDSLQLPVQALMLVQGFNGLRLTIIFRLTNIYWIGDAKEGYPRIDRIGPRGFDRYMYNIWGGFVLAAAIPKKRMRPMLVRDPRGRSFCSLVRSHIPSGTLAPVTHFVRHAWETSAVTDSIPST